MKVIEEARQVAGQGLRRIPRDFPTRSTCEVEVSEVGGGSSGRQADRAFFAQKSSAVGKKMPLGRSRSEDDTG